MSSAGVVWYCRAKLTSNHRASMTYSPCIRFTSTIELLMLPCTSYCFIIIATLMTAHPISPGRSSQKYFKSKDPMRGFSWCPIKKSYATCPVEHGPPTTR